MQRVHFIAIGGFSALDLAIAVSKKSNFRVTGSDLEFSDASLQRLKEHGLLPDKLGWHPEIMNKNLNAVVLGTEIKDDNPELLKAKELGLKIFSIPEFLFLQTRSKTRIVVAGSTGKTTITAMIIFVLTQLKIDNDYLIGAHIKGYSNRIKLSYDSRIAVFEGDDSPTSSIDPRPKFHHYKPHIAVLTSIGNEFNAANGTFENYASRFSIFAELMEVQGRLIYNNADENLNKIAGTLRRDIVPFAYTTAEHEVMGEITYLITKNEKVPLKISGEQELLNLNAARLACKQIGVTDDQFYSIISNYQPIELA